MMDYKAKRVCFRVTLSIVVFVIAGAMVYTLASKKEISPFTLTVLYSAIGIMITTQMMLVSWEISRDIRQSKKHFKSNMSLLKNYIEIRDRDIMDVIDKIYEEMNCLVDQACKNNSVTLKLDDLFDIVTQMMEKPDIMEIKAVDIEVNRWEQDVRAHRYFESNENAILRGANIERVYVVSPNISYEQFKNMISTIKRHLMLNEVNNVKRNSGIMKIRGIYWSEMPQDARCRDFAIFKGKGDDDKKVLYEKFNERWISTFQGDFTKNNEDIRYYETIFKIAWNNAIPLGDADDIDRWANNIKRKYYN